MTSFEIPDMFCHFDINSEVVLIANISGEIFLNVVDLKSATVDGVPYMM